MTEKKFSPKDHVKETNKDKETSEDTSRLEHVETDNLRKAILAMLRKHETMWTTPLGQIRATHHYIELEMGTKPVQQMPYRKGPDMRQLVSNEIEKLLTADVIERATSEWACPVVIVPKKDGSLRFRIDYRKLHAKTLTDTYPLPRMDDCIDSLGDAQIY